MVSLMSCKDAVTLRDVSKIFQIYDRPIDRLFQFFHKEKKLYSEFVAVQPINVKILQGESIGIIGVNGSGKSTLLQLICGIYKPTSGAIQSYGRIAALLELGAGFNMEYTGIENVYLNASLYGLTKDEIDTRIEKIKDFAAIGDFFYQPIKTYSSGMIVRLAFSIIAYIDAKILVIDEALAVGDAIFVQKCMRFIREFKKSGTLIFVSHDMSSVINLCDRVIWMDKGAARAFGPAKEIAEQYLQFSLEQLIDDQENISYQTLTPAKDQAEQSKSLGPLNNASGWKTGYVEIAEIALTPLSNTDKTILEGGEKVRLTIKVKAHKKINGAIIGFLWRDRLGQDLFGESVSLEQDLSPLKINAGGVVICNFEFTVPYLPNGEYAIACAVAEGTLDKNIQHQWLHNALMVKVFSDKPRWGLIGIQCDSIQLITQ